MVLIFYCFFLVCICFCHLTTAFFILRHLWMTNACVACLNLSKLATGKLLLRHFVAFISRHVALLLVSISVCLCLYTRVRVCLRRCEVCTVRHSERPFHFRFACSISMSSVCVGAPPLQCFWYRWSSPLLATTWISGSTPSNLLNLSCRTVSKH